MQPSTLFHSTNEYNTYEQCALLYGQYTAEYARMYGQ